MFGNLRDKILGKKDIASEIVVIPQWDNAKLKVQALTGKERYELFELVSDSETGDVDNDKLYWAMIIFCTRDPASGERVFEWKDRKELEEKNGKAVSILAEKAMDLSGLGGAKIKEAEKNSKADIPS